MPPLLFLTVIRPVFPFGNIRFQLKLRKHRGGLRLNKKIEIFIWSRISKFLRPAQRYDDLNKTSKTAVVLLAGVTISGTPCPPAEITKTRGRITVKQENRNFLYGPVSPNFCARLEIFIWSRISKFLRPAQRYDDLNKTSKTAVVLLAGVTISGTPCPRFYF